MNISSSSSQNRPRIDRLDSGRSSARPGGGLWLNERVIALRDRLEARADTRAAASLRADVREARGYVRDWHLDRAVSQDTAKRYARAVEAMKGKGERPEDASCKATFEFRRAALVHETKAELKTALRDLDKAKRAGDLERATDAYVRVHNGLETLRRYPPTTGSREQDLQRRSAYSGPVHANPDRSNGKRGSLDQLPEDWRDRAQAAARPEDRAPLAVMALTGCRPAEVKGIKVRQDDERVTLEIRGAKYDEDRGIKNRTITIDKSDLANSQAGRDLADWLGGREVRTMTHRGDTAAFRERVARAADRAGLESVSAYTYRHAEARELKDAGTDRVEIAARMGHRSERSQSVYG